LIGHLSDQTRSRWGRRRPVINCGHTPPYYEGLVTSYGFTPLRTDNIAYAVDLTQDNREFRLLHKLAEKAAERGTAVVRQGRMDERSRSHPLFAE
jgi:hypothetical protein